MQVLFVLKSVSSNILKKAISGLPKGLCFRARLSANVVIIKKMIFFILIQMTLIFTNDFALKYIFVLKVHVFWNSEIQKCYITVPTCLQKQGRETRVNVRKKNI